MIRKITPIRIKKYLKLHELKKKINIYREFLLDAKVFIKYSNSFDNNNNEKNY